MIDVEDTLRAELHRLGAVDARPDWDEIAARAGLKHGRRRRRWAVGLAVAASATVVGVATPLGSAIARELSGFSAWLTGRPGSPISREEQRAFDASNARSWVGFPRGTELRRLITRHVDGATVELVGFRSGSSSLCLRVTVQGKTRASSLNCAPLAELRRAGAPARVVMIDHGVGHGDKVAWYGVDRLHSADLQITAGIAADGVHGVVLEDDAGRHEVAAVSNAFLYVAQHPDVGQRVRRIWARTATGLVRVPFAPALFGFGGSGRGGAAPPAPRIERTVNGGRIGWLERREPRGRALDVLPARTRTSLLGWRRHTILFGRVLAPDPDRPLRLVVTLNAHRRGGSAAGLCTMLVGRTGGGGGCMPYPGVFADALIPSGMMGGGSGEFVTVDGVATDDVARIDALLANGQRVHVPLRDNAFLVEIPRATLPARLVAYDAGGRVISVGEPLRDFGGGPTPARARATRLLRVSGPDGATAELLVGPSASGGECMYVRHYLDRRHTGVMVGCKGRSWSGPPLQLSTEFAPARFVAGRVRPDVRIVRIRFADRAFVDLRPTRGYILYAVPRGHLGSDRGAVSAEGRRADGSLVGRVSFPHLKGH